MQNQFKEIPASKSSLTRRTPIYGVGINDADYMTRQEINNKQVICPFYVKWQGMMRRCYSVEYQKNRPTYIGCTVSKDWHLFSNFKSWMEKQDWHGKQLDKDILVQGNKTYSRESCIFVEASINTLLNNCSSTRGELMLGVTLDKENNKFRALCSNSFGKRITIGRYSTELEAHEAYKKYKYKLISDIALQQTEPLKSAMLNHVILEY